VTDTSARIGDLAVEIESGFACARSKLVEDGLPHLRPFNIGEDGVLANGQVYRVPFNIAPTTKRRISGGDILFNNTNSAELVGKSAYAPSDMEAGFSNHVTRITLDRTRCEPEFVARYLHHIWRRGYFRSRCTRWVSQAAFNTTAIASLQVPLPPLEEQRRIVDILNHAAGIRRLREQARAKAKELIPALFLDMFGDPATNPKGFYLSSIAKVGKVQGGLQVTTKRSVNPIERPYLRVANVYRDQLDLSEIKLIRVTQDEAARAALIAGDILIVEGHGNPDEIRRCAVWDGSIEPCVHQNHLIRVRLDSKNILPIYLSTFLNSSTGRLHLLRAGKTTSGLNTISTKNVAATEVVLPPISLQHAFAERVADIQATIDQMDRAAEAAEQLQAALMARLFDGMST
jgi:restriction endonuclease S subunit